MARTGFRSVASLTVGCALVAATSLGAGAMTHANPAPRLADGIHVFGSGLHLRTPGVVATIDGRIWVANEGSASAIGDSMVEFDAATGAYLRTVTRVAIAAPRQLLACGGSLWLGTGYGSIVQLDGVSGRVVRTVRGPDFRKSNTQALTCGQEHVWIVSADLAPRHRSTTIDERSSATGALLRRMNLPVADVVFPSGIAVSNGEVWVTASTRHSVTVVNDVTGAVVRTYADAGAIRSGGAVLATGGRVYVVDFDSLVELDARSGAILRTLRGTGYRFDLPDALVADGPVLLVVSAGNAVTAVATGTGAPRHVYRGPPYRFDDPAAAARVGNDLWVANALGQSVTEFSLP